MFIFQLNQAEHHYLAILSFVLALPWPLLLHWLTNNCKKAHPNQSYEDGKQEETSSKPEVESSDVKGEKTESFPILTYIISPILVLLGLASALIGASSNIDYKQSGNYC